MQQVLEKVKNEPFFKWPNKVTGNPVNHNQNLYCHYHQDHGHTIEDCRNLWDHLEQLVREGKLKHLLHHSSGQGSQTNSAFWGNVVPRPPLGTINVIFAALGRTGSCPSRIMSVSYYSNEGSSSMPKRIKMNVPLVLGFSDEDKLGTIQPHDDALVITLRIGGYDVKIVMIDQGSAAEIMYPDLYKGLDLKPEKCNGLQFSSGEFRICRYDVKIVKIDQGSAVEIMYLDLYKGLDLKPENLTAYSSPLVSFEGKMVVPKG